MEENKELGFADVLSIIQGDISASDILKFTNVVPIKNEDGSFKVKPNKWTLNSKIILNPGDVVNVKTRIETTIGRAIANKLLKIDPFGDFFPFDNNPIVINDNSNKIIVNLLKNDITTDQMIIYFNNIIWLTRFADMILPSLSRTVLVTPKSTVKLREQLTEQYKDLIEKGDTSYVDKVEKPVLDDIVNQLKNDPSFMLYRTGKPSISNNLKQSIGTFSPIYNISKGKYDIPNGNLLTGHDPQMYDSIANMNISGIYARNIDTRDGGSIVKTIYNSMNMMKAGPKGTDCGTKKYKTVTLTEENKTLYIWNYIMEPGGRLILVTPDNINSYIGKTCSFRSALYCNYDRFEICNICCGEIPYKTNLLAIGLLSSRLPFQILKSSLKKFHNSTVQLTGFNPFNYMKMSK